MSPAMDVIINPDSGPTFHAVLKLYDRRFGTDLRKVQGESPRHIDTTTLRSRALGSAADADVAPVEMAPYVKSKGVLVQHIPGYNLWDLPESSAAPQKHDGQDTFIIDFAECWFKDRLIQAWEERDDSGPEDHEGQEDDDDEAWDPEVEYWERVISTDNTGAIGSVMAMLVLKAKGMKLDIKYPDCQRIIQDIKCREGNSI
ncbi:hypothetical protein ACJZ2D_000793 [Fusarium nematophilum]